MYANDDILLVAARSDVFSAMFEHEMEERKHVSTQIMCCIYAHFLRFNIINLWLIGTLSRHYCVVCGYVLDTYMVFVAEVLYGTVIAVVVHNTRFPC